MFNLVFIDFWVDRKHQKKNIIGASQNRGEAVLGTGNLRVSQGDPFLGEAKPVFRERKPNNPKHTENFLRNSVPTIGLVTRCSPKSSNLGVAPIRAQKTLGLLLPKAH